jgi:endonuclease YncB( thermonuclease family)
VPFTLIEGTFHVVGRSPDGDSLGFRASNPAHWAKLDGPPAKLNSQGITQLRFEAIDALETHYTPPGQHREYHQPRGLAEAATDALLAAAGITNIEWDQAHRTVMSANDGVPGYILSRSVEQNHRPVAFVYAGGAPGADGGSVHLDVALVQQSINFQLADSGLAYPTYYRKLFPDLRDAFTQAVVNAREAGRGVWKADATQAGAVAMLADLQDKTPILPKLFRRLMEYMDGVDDQLQDFKAFLAAKADALLILSSRHFTHLDTVVNVNLGASSVSLTVPPEDLVFEE